MIEICLLIIPNAFYKAKRQAEENDHQRICVEGKFWHNLVFYALGCKYRLAEGSTLRAWHLQARQFETKYIR